MLLATAALMASLVTRKGSPSTGSTDTTETPVSALLSAGHTYTQHTGRYCPTCTDLLTEMQASAVTELDADGEEYVPAFEDMGDMHPEGCSCDRDPLTGERGFDQTGEVPSTVLTGVRRANDRSEGALKYACALETRADEMGLAAALAFYRGDAEEVERCETDQECLSDLATAALSEVTGSLDGIEGCWLDTLSMLDDGDTLGRWAHERDAYLSDGGEMVRGELSRADRPLAYHELPGTPEHRATAARVMAAKAAKEGAAARWVEARRVAQLIAAGKTAERKAMARMAASAVYQYIGLCMAEYKAFKTLGQVRETGKADAIKLAVVAWQTARKTLATRFPAMVQYRDGVVDGARVGWVYELRQMAHKYQEGVARCFATEGEPQWSELYLTKAQSSYVWDVAFGRR